jgi:hypothetical protein
MGEYRLPGELSPAERPTCLFMRTAELFERSEWRRDSRTAFPASLASRDFRQHERRGVDIEPDNEIDVVIGPAAGANRLRPIPSGSKLPPNRVASYG